MHTTLNGSSFLSYETTVANAYKAARSPTERPLLHMSIKPQYPPDFPADAWREVPTHVGHGDQQVYSLSPMARERDAGSVCPDSFDNPSDAVVVINLNIASKEQILAAYKGTLSPDVHRVVDAILAVRPKSSADDLRASSSQRDFPPTR